MVTPVPDTLEGQGDEVTRRGHARLVGTLNPGDSGAAVDSVEASDSMEAVSSRPPDSTDDPGRITRPYETTRKTARASATPSPGVTTPDEDAEPLSVSGELRRSLSESPPSDEAKIHEEHRRFRHRGPFTRAQAEIAISQAPDVLMVMEVLVRYARQFFERCVLFVVENGEARLRLAHGVGIELASLSVSLEAPSVLRGAYQSGDPIVSELSHEASTP